MKRDVLKQVKKAQRGKKDALLQLIMAEKDDFYRLAFSYLKNEHDAIDVMEDMIVILYEKIAELKEPTAFYSWAKTILVNRAKRLLKQQKREVFVEQIYEASGGIHFDIEEKQRQMELADALAILSEVQREAIVLKHLHDYPYDAIAVIQQVSIGTVKSRVFNGMEKLKSYDWGEQNG